MAVPKRKTAKSKTKMRRAANSKMTATDILEKECIFEGRQGSRV